MTVVDSYSDVMSPWAYQTFRRIGETRRPHRFEPHLIARHGRTIQTAVAG
jgi:hypothetical protein